MKYTIINPNLSDTNAKKGKYKVKEWRCHSFHNAEKLAAFHRENAEVVVARRTPMCGPNPKRAVLVLIEP